MNVKKLLHIEGIYRSFILYLVNRVYAGITTPSICKKKRTLLIKLGYEIGEGTTIVGPIECNGNLIIGKNCWIGKNFKVNGNGNVHIGDNCDIAPEVTFQTGTHFIGTSERRAGQGVSCNQSVGDGTWIGVRVTVINDACIGKGCVIAGGAMVTGDIPDNLLVGGIPAIKIRKIDD